MMPWGGGGEVVVVVDAAAVHYCLLEIADVQILSQGDCLAKNLTILRIPFDLIYFALPLYFNIFII